MEHQFKMNTAILNNGAGHNSTLRDFFETYASSSESAELANRLPDYLFQRSLTSQDEKFSVSRFVYSSPDVEKRFDQKFLHLPPQSDTQHVSKLLYNTMKNKHYARETNNDATSSSRSITDGQESMSEAEKLYLYRKLLMQNKNEDHPSVVKHRRLMLDFQTRRDFVRADNVVLPVSVLHKEGLDGIQGKIVYLRNPVNRIRPALVNKDSRSTKRYQDEKRDGLHYRPKTAPITTSFGSKPTLVTLKPLTSLNKPNPVNITRRVKSGVSFTPRYKSMMEGKQKIVAGNGSSSLNTELLEFDIRNAMPLSARSSRSQENATRDNDVEKEEIITDANEAVDSRRRSSEASDSSAPATPRLSLNVFIPREIEEVRMCNLPEDYGQAETVVKKEPDPIPGLSKNIIESAKTAGLISSRYGLSRTTRDLLLSKCSAQNSQYPRFQYTQANLSPGTTSINSKKAPRCDLFAPPGQSQTKNTGNGHSNYIRSQRTISPALRLDGHRSTFI